MRPILLFAVLVLLLRSSASPREDPAPAAPPKIDALAWLAGSWRAEEVGGARAEENWTEPLGGTMLATARQVRGGRTAFFEFLRIEERKDGALVYVAMPMGRKGVDFAATEVGVSEVVFENPGHDSPKRILYRVEGDELVTRVDDGPEDREGHEARYRRAR